MNIERTLKASPAREVVLAEDPENPGRKLVAKRFLGGGLLRSLRARAGARREHSLLEALAEAGLPVPRPLGLARFPGGWEVRMEAIPDARPLAEHLRDPGTLPDRPRLARRLGRLLGRTHGVGLDHPDLHLGNVLVDGSGHPWLLDLHKAKLRSPLGAERVEEDLARAAAALREHLGAAARGRALVAWSRALPDKRRGSRRRALAVELEEGARARRREVVENGTGRWSRTSGVCRRDDSPAGAVVRRWDLPATFAETAREAGADVLVLDEHSTRGLRRRWERAVRLHEHGIPVAVPACLVLGHEIWAAFTLPPEAVVLPGEEEATDDGPARELGVLLGLLHDRGLDLRSLSLADAWARSPRGLVLRPPTELAPFDPRPGDSSRDRRFRAVDRAVAARPSFLEGYLSAFAPQPVERAALARELAPDQ